MAKFLIESGADVNEITDRVDIPLLRACKKGLEKTVDLLISHGANPNYTDLNGDSTMARVCGVSSVTIVKKLIDAGGDINTGSLLFASKNPDTAVLKLLLETEGVSINYMNQHGETALHIAAERGNEESVKLLLDKGASVTVSNLPFTNIYGSVLTKLLIKAGIPTEKIEIVHHYPKTGDYQDAHTIDSTGTHIFKPTTPIITRKKLSEVPDLEAKLKKEIADESGTHKGDDHDLGGGRDLGGTHDEVGEGLVQPPHHGSTDGG